MNVALFPSLYHPHVGGVESMSRHLAAGLRTQTLDRFDQVR